MNTNELFRPLYRLFFRPLERCLLDLLRRLQLDVRPHKMQGRARWLVEYFFVVTSLGVAEFDHLRIARHAYFFQNSL